jgi:hypothetical protein
MTSAEQNEKLWRVLDNYFGWLQQQEESEYEVNNTQAYVAYSDAAIELIHFLKEEDVYDLLIQQE